MSAADYDVVVAGGGPAGATAAFTLARTGHRVLLAEDSRYARTRLGDALSPTATALLDRLGLGAATRGCAIPSTGITSAWGGDEPYSHSFLFSPHGEGVHVDRQRFDRNLAAAAANAGAHLVDARVTACAPVNGAGWRVAMTGRPAVTTRSVIDATGRHAAVSRACGARRVRHDRLVAIAADYRGQPAHHGQVLIEAARDGWWYAAPVPPDRLVVMFLTDTDICREHHYPDPRPWLDHLRRTRHIHDLTTGRTPIRGPELRSAAGGHVVPRPAPGPWLAVGDAALAKDPLSGGGIDHALDNGRAGAEAVAALLADTPGPARDYQRDLITRRTEYLAQRTAHYRLEQRWPESAFWSRRHRAPTTPDSAAARATATTRP
ncbi:MAG: FAD-binding protein [Saccharothrix sp.]|nr:FAD-binding protein [Saccharothrix sp.]